MKPKILCIQISNTLINGKPDLTDISQKYHNTLYKVKSKEGYIKPSEFWEIPLWVTEISFNVDTELYVCKDIDKTVDYLLLSNYGYVCFSVLEVNKDIIQEIIKKYNSRGSRDSTFVLGGYIDFTKFFLSNTLYAKTIKEFIELLGIKYKQGNSYRLFKDFKTIPRLTLSKGCLNHCDFCTVENKIIKTSVQVIEQQVKAFKPLKFKLVYINDKTFGQCSNYKLLPRIYKAIKEYNKDFKGFIIQTTTGQILKLSDKFIKDSHIKYIELGVESWNDSILKKYHKPSREILCIQAFEKIQRLYPDRVIPNVIIGIPEETQLTYSRTLEFLTAYKTIISHLNIYNLVVYNNTELNKRIKSTDADKNELSVTKSFHKDKYLHQAFYNAIHSFGIDVLKEGLNDST